MRNELVICKNGERFETFGDNNQGVEFDGGTIPWAEVDGFLCFHKPTNRWMYVPA